MHEENYFMQTKCKFYNKLWCKSTFILEKTKTLMSCILLTGARAPVTLELCRAFARQGHRVFLADVTLFPIARWSTCAEAYFRIPAPVQQFNLFAETLKKLITQHHIDHLIPTCEEAFYVSKIKDQLPCRVWTSGFDLMVNLHHKQRFLDLAKNFFQIPNTASCTDFNDWKKAETYVFKPVFSRFGSRVIIGQAEAKCREPRQNPEDWIAQELLSGQEICVYSIWRNGQIGGFAAYRPVQRAGKGASVYFEAFFRQDIFDAVQRFGEHYHFEGQLSFDLMLVNDKIYALECNPRSTSGAHLLGPDLVRCFFSDELIVQRKPKARMIRLAWLLSQGWKAFGSQATKAEDVIWNSKDKKPAFLQILSVLELLFLAIRYRQSISAVSTRDIEFNGE